MTSPGLASVDRFVVYRSFQHMSGFHWGAPYPWTYGRAGISSWSVQTKACEDHSDCLDDLFSCSFLLPRLFQCLGPYWACVFSPTDRFVVCSPAKFLYDLSRFSIRIWVFRFFLFLFFFCYSFSTFSVISSKTIFDVNIRLSLRLWASKSWRCDALFIYEEWKNMRWRRWSWQVFYSVQRILFRLLGRSIGFGFLFPIVVMTTPKILKKPLDCLYAVSRFVTVNRDY